jgi:hypothetical protein
MAFWDYVYTTFLLVVLFMMIVGLAAFVYFRRERPEMRKSHQSRAVRSVATLLLVCLLVFFVGRHIDLNNIFHPHGSKSHGRNGILGLRGPGGSSSRRHAQFRWEELALVLGLLVVLGAIAGVTRRRLGPGTQRQFAPELLAAALDESLEDLRDHPDLRSAIIAAYARMERALAAAGLPRHHAEAPLEYMERALLTLDTSAAAVRRLTDLFEWARFSQHEPEPSMRDEALDALMAVRDELREADWVAPWVAT